MVSNLKRCPQCSTTKSSAEFYVRGGDRGNEPASMCKACRVNYNRNHHYNAIYYQRHKNESVTRVKKWCSKNRNKVREAQRRRYSENKNKHRTWRMDYRKNNPEKIKEWDRNKRARRRKSIGSFSSKEWESLKLKFGHRCLRCKQSEPEIKLTVDHIIPLIRGGTNFISNIQPLCFSCNSSKGSNAHDYRLTASRKAATIRPCEPS